MPDNSRKLFIALAALSWSEPVPEACLEAIWSVLGQESMFPLVVCKLVEGSLLTKTDSDPLYNVHDMVSLYLDSKMIDSVKILLSQSNPEESAFVSPWLFIFGKETVKKVSQQNMEFILNELEEKQVVITLEGLIEALMASMSISEFEASRAGFSTILGPIIASLMSRDSQRTVVVSAKVITNIFTKGDYCKYIQSLENIGAIEKLATILENCEDPIIQTSISTVLAKLAEYGSSETADAVLQRIPMNLLADLLSPHTEEFHDSVFTILMSLIQAGKSRAVEKMFYGKIDKTLIELLETGSEVAQNNAIVILKALYELGGSIRPDTFNLLPWQARVSLEKFVLPERNFPATPRPQTFEDLIQKLADNEKKCILEAMQDLIPIIERAGDSKIREMIVKSPLIKRLAELLQCSQLGQNSMRSESAFILMKLACSGGEPCIKKFLEYDIILELVKMMQCNVTELQDSAYTALHQILSSGEVLILSRILQMGLVEKLVHAMDSKSVKTREVNVHFILDIVEVGNRSTLERMLSLQLVEKLVKIENANGNYGETVVGFIKGMDKCKHLSTAERRVMKQQVVRKVRAALKGHRFETKILAAVDAYVGEGSKGASTSGSGRNKRK